MAYEFDITTAFAAADPFPNRIDTTVYPGDTGYIQIANAGLSDYSGILNMVAISAYDGDVSYDITNAFIPAGGSLSFGLAVDSSMAGGFNSFTGTNTPSVPGTFRPGIILYMQGSVTGAGGSGAIKIAVQDLDITTGVTVTDPNGFETDSFVLQGGDPYGLYNGDAWELDEPDGHYVFQGLAVPEPGTAGTFAIAFAGLLMVRNRRRADTLANPVVSDHTHR